MKHVFISYVRENEEQVNKLYENLTRHGVKVWLDRNDIGAGSRWKGAIRRAMVIYFDWSEADLNDAHAIFEKHSNMIERHGEFSKSEFERDFNVRFGIDWRGLKTVINTFYDNSYGQDVCIKYVEAHEGMAPLELKRIEREISKGKGQ